MQDIAMAEIISGNESPYKFYIEEFEMNHLPSIGYLNKKIIEYSDGRLSLMVNYSDKKKPEKITVSGFNFYLF